MKKVKSAYWESRNSLAGRGIAQRVTDYGKVYRAIKDHRAAVRAYCAGNKWLEANAKSVGNW